MADLRRLCAGLISTAIKLYANDSTGIADVRDQYAMDSTTIDLCLALLPGARFRKHKGAVKMHTLLDLHGSIPTFIHITNGKVANVSRDDRWLRQLEFKPCRHHLDDPRYQLIPQAR